jgi:DNA mismatch repair protein MutH
MMSDVQLTDSLASEDGHGASISEKPWADTAPDDQHGKVDEAVAKLGEVLRARPKKVSNFKTLCVTSLV